MLRWGLVPFWSKEPGGKRPLINARAEGIETKPSFRGPIRHRRCIVPASGFYEWRREGTGKQPYFVRPAEDEVFALAAIWDHWEGKQGEVIESVAIITTSANELMQPIHDRMPVIFEEEDVAEWIAPTTKLEKALPMLKPCSLTVPAMTGRRALQKWTSRYLTNSEDRKSGVDAQIHRRYLGPGKAVPRWPVSH